MVVVLVPVAAPVSVAVPVAASVGAVVVDVVVVVVAPVSVEVLVEVAEPSVDVVDVPPSVPVPPHAVNEAASATLAAARAIVWNFTINLIRLLRELSIAWLLFFLLAYLPRRQVSNFCQPDEAK